MFLKYIIFTAVLIVVAASTKINPSLLRTLHSKQTANIIINFVGGNKDAINLIESRTFTGRAEKITFLKATLEKHASISQRGVQQYLQKNGIAFDTLWISNQIIIKRASQQVVQQLAHFPQVRDIIEEGVIRLMNPIGPQQVLKKGNADLAWGVQKVQAEEVWKITNGTGVVVGQLDTGVRYSHEALIDSFRGIEYGWMDFARGEEIPYDNYVHGTHVQGIISGSNGIGMAPGSKWMACQTCANNVDCDIGNYAKCAQWMICPTKPDGSSPDCSKAPHIINNSWGQPTEGNEDYFDNAVEALRAAGIIPIFAGTNFGPNCGTAGYPGLLPKVISTGATDASDGIAIFSSRGPTYDGRLKPELSSPGFNIYSALPYADDSYGLMSGTSMATPSLTGVSTLIISAYPNITFDQLREVLIEGAETDLRSTNETCGGIPDTIFPNNVFGHGRINALKSLQAAQRIFQ